MKTAEDNHKNSQHCKKPQHIWGISKLVYRSVLLLNFVTNIESSMYSILYVAYSISTDWHSKQTQPDTTTRSQHSLDILTIEKMSHMITLTPL